MFGKMNYCLMAQQALANVVLGHPPSCAHDF